MELPSEQTFWPCLLFSSHSVQFNYTFAAPFTTQSARAASCNVDLLHCHHPIRCFLMQSSLHLCFFSVFTGSFSKHLGWSTLMTSPFFVSHFVRLFSHIFNINFCDYFRLWLAWSWVGPFSSWNRVCCWGEWSEFHLLSEELYIPQTIRWKHLQ